MFLYFSSAYLSVLHSEKFIQMYHPFDFVLIFFCYLTDQDFILFLFLIFKSFYILILLLKFTFFLKISIRQKDIL